MFLVVGDAQICFLSFALPLGLPHDWVDSNCPIFAFQVKYWCPIFLNHFHNDEGIADLSLVSQIE